jgi:tRNA pseudouridine32 synthase/23S rRNA pseudouridine746 synthase
MRVETEFIVDENCVAIDALKRGVDDAGIELSKQKLKNAMLKGAVWFLPSDQGRSKNSTPARLRRVKRNVKPGDRFYLYFDEHVLGSKPPEPELMLDKEKWSVWFKPAGVLSQGSRFGDHCSLPRLVEQKLQRSCFIVHRLDRAASGLMMLAHDRQTAAALSDLFRERKIKKHYLVKVEGSPPEDEFSCNEPLDKKEAISHAVVIAREEERTLLDVRIETGRKHQIRRHLAGAGFPVQGDRMYGQATSGRLMLMAVSLEFECPVTGVPVKVEVPSSRQQEFREGA